MKRITTALRIILAAFLIPWMLMASFFSLSQTNPPKIDAPVLKDVMKLTPVWHDLSTAYRNQFRLILAGLPIATILAAISMMINPKRRRMISAYTLGATTTIALMANGFDCFWLFRTRPEWIGAQTAIRSIPWLIIGAICLKIMTGKQKANNGVPPNPRSPSAHGFGGR